MRELLVVAGARPTAEALVVAEVALVRRDQSAVAVVHVVAFYSRNTTVQAHRVFFAGHVFPVSWFTSIVSFGTLGDRFTKIKNS